MSGHIIPMSYSYSKFLLYSSFTIGISAAIAYIMNDLYVTAYLIFLFLTSINYWRKPEYGLRRNIDLTAVYLCTCYTVLNMFLLKDEFHRVCLFIVFFCMNLFFLIENILYYFNNRKWIIFHMAMHMYVSIGACLIVFD
jgi:hypothetical protein